jgi:hypothetical protein
MLNSCYCCSLLLTQDSKEIKIVFISNGGDAYARMMNRSAISRAHVVEFQEATVAEAFDFLKDRLGEAKFNEKKDELVDLVKTYTGGKFQTLVDVAKGVGDLKGISFSSVTHIVFANVMISLGKMCQLREDAKNHLQTFWMHHPDEKLKQEMKDKEKKDEERRKAKKALVLKDIGNHVVKNGKIDRRLLIIKLSGRMKEEELRRMNIFAYHHSTNSYSFATPALKTVYQVQAILLLFLFLFLYYCCLGDCHSERRRGSSEMRGRRNQHEQINNEFVTLSLVIA